MASAPQLSLDSKRLGIAQPPKYGPMTKPCSSEGIGLCAPILQQKDFGSSGGFVPTRRCTFDHATVLTCGRSPRNDYALRNKPRKSVSAQ